ncbi:Uncharacterized protein FWK35_00026670 [Aphis craccivora]|uniref:Uncharacterized protein n=1 Tax=Aphis craccivora TaxID=307492 RepID=A0A6G0Y3Y6_APHCR|nr:Uncharacterized protein FWK35_00026670 [Aphis craccivora]
MHDILKDINVKTYENLIIIGIDANLKFLSKSTTFYADGIFLNCRNLFFNQFFTIYSKKNNNYIISLNAFMLTLNYKIVRHNAINEVWPLTKVCACRFYLMKFGLSSEYVQNADKSQYLTYIHNQLGISLPMNWLKYIENNIDSDLKFSEIWAKKAIYIQADTTIIIRSFNIIKPNVKKLVIKLNSKIRHRCKFKILIHKNITQ